jgi:hypothetical protein
LKRDRRQQLGFLLVPFSKPHARTAAVLVDELDAGGLERSPNHRERGVTRFGCLAFK